MREDELTPELIRRTELADAFVESLMEDVLAQEIACKIMDTSPLETLIRHAYLKGWAACDREITDKLVAAFAGRA